MKFANNDKSLLATGSLDGCLVICQVIPSPATTIYRLEGHQSGIMGISSSSYLTILWSSRGCVNFCFLPSDLQWNTTNDLIVTGSLDGTCRVWQVTKGKCMRVLKDTCGAQVLCCCFQPLNENMIFVSITLLFGQNKSIRFSILKKTILLEFDYIVKVLKDTLWFSSWF